MLCNKLNDNHPERDKRENKKHKKTSQSVSGIFKKIILIHPPKFPQFCNPTTKVEQLVTEYVDFYNFKRISLKNGLTPVEFRSKAV